MDWYSRRYFSLATFQYAEHGLLHRRLEEAIARYGTPEIFNTDQGSQFTSAEFTGVLKAHGIGSAWMAKAAGGTTSSSSACGER